MAIEKLKTNYKMTQKYSLDQYTN